MVICHASSHGSSCRSTRMRISSATAIAGCVSFNWIAALSGSVRMSPLCWRMCRRNQVLQRGGREEVFLPQPQFLSRRRLVARIQHLRDGVGAVARRQRADMVAAIERVEPQRIRRPRRPEPQRVGVVSAPADDRRVVGDRVHGLGRVPDVARAAIGHRPGLDRAAEADQMGGVRPRDLPWIAEGQPVLRIFLLPAIVDDLAEHPVIVADAVAVRGDAQCRHALHEAGGQPAEAAIAQRGVMLDVAQPVVVDAEFGRARRACDRPGQGC